MARKSNKTAHVLSLLTNPKAAEQTAAASPETQSTASEPAPTAAAVSPDPVQPAAAAAETPAPPAPAAEAAPLSPAPAEASVLPPLTIDPAQLEERLSLQIQDSLEKALAAEEAEPPPPPQPAPKLPPMPPAGAAGRPDAPVQAAVQADAPPAAPVLVNVLEELLDRFQTDFMERFGMCTCPRCVLDTRALTLSRLTGKYVVLPSDTVSAMLNFYEHRYQGMLTAQLTQACMLVMQEPRHN